MASSPDSPPPLPPRRDFASFPEGQQADRLLQRADWGNPFGATVVPGPYGVNEAVTVAELHQDSLTRLTDAIDAGSAAAGQPLMLLTAPRAGYGKTHLLGRVAAASGHQYLLLPLAFRSGDSVNLATVGRRTMEALAAADSDRPGWSRLREACCGVCAVVLRRMIESGDLPCANPDQAKRVVTQSPAEVFDQQGAARVIGNWLLQHAEELKPAFAKVLGREVVASPTILSAWMTSLLDQSMEGGASGIAAMRDLLNAEEGGEGCLTWLRLLSLWRPTILLVDHLDAFYRNTEAGLSIASLLLDLADGHGIHVVLSLNQDVWQATFGHHLPAAMEDRLTSAQVLLRGLTTDQATHMTRLRLSEAGVDDETSQEFLAFLDIPQYFLGRPLGSVAARAFLRHVSAQWEFFIHSLPSPDSAASSGNDSHAPLPPGTPSSGGGAGEGGVPLLTETVEMDAVENAQQAASAVPLFDDQTQNRLRLTAEGLTEPIAALPQDEAPSLFTPSSETVAAPQASDWNTAATTPTPPTESASPSATGATGTDLETRPADAFEKLRGMLERLRQPGTAAASVAALGGAAAAIPPASNSSIRPASSVHEAALIEKASSHQALLGRFEALRLQMSAEAESKPLDYTKVAELIRLAGKRFPVVRFSEHELPGLTGRYAMTWAIQGMEILFGLAHFTDHSYWHTLAGFGAGRLAELQAAVERENTPEVKWKLATFQTEAGLGNAGLQDLVANGTLPETLREKIDLITLDFPQLASLYAMQRMIKEAETGALEAPPPQVMSVLARELDFLWKRITRSH